MEKNTNPSAAKTSAAALETQPGWATIERINALLIAQGGEIVQMIDRGGYQLFGYEPQPVIDAVNEVLGPDGWSYELVGDPEVRYGEKDVMAIVRVRTSLRLAPSILVSAEAWGASTQGMREPGDAINGAITRALQKAWARLSIGRHAFRGELESLWAGAGDRKGAAQKPPAKDGALVCSECRAALVRKVGRDGRVWMKCPKRKSVKDENGAWVDAPGTEAHDFLAEQEALDRTRAPEDLDPDLPAEDAQRKKLYARAEAAGLTKETFYALIEAKIGRKASAKELTRRECATLIAECDAMVKAKEKPGGLASQLEPDEPIATSPPIDEDQPAAAVSGVVGFLGYMTPGVCAGCGAKTVEANDENGEIYWACPALMSELVWKAGPRGSFRPTVDDPKLAGKHTLVRF